MIALYLAPPIVAFLLLGAHFLRSESYAPLVVCALMIALVFVRRPWAARTVQVALVLGALEWARSALTLIHARSAMGEPYLRLAVILGGVALFTLLCALILQRRRAKMHYRITSSARTSTD